MVSVATTTLRPWLRTLIVAVPSALYNLASGSLNRGFRIAASFTSGANPNRLAMICLIEIACWWFWARSRPSAFRQMLALAAMGASTMVLFGTGSRSGLLGVGVLAILLQTSPRTFRVSAGQASVLAAAAALEHLDQVADRQLVPARRRRRDGPITGLGRGRPVAGGVRNGSGTGSRT